MCFIYHKSYRYKFFTLGKVWNQTAWWNMIYSSSFILYHSCTRKLYFTIMISWCKTWILNTQTIFLQTQRSMFFRQKKWNEGIESSRLSELNETLTIWFMRMLKSCCFRYELSIQSTDMIVQSFCCNLMLDKRQLRAYTDSFHSFFLFDDLIKHTSIVLIDWIDRILGDKKRQ